MTTGTSLLSFVTCASCDVTLESNLLASPCFTPDFAPAGRRNQELPEHRGWAQYWHRTGRDGMGRLRSSRRLASGGMGPMRFQNGSMKQNAGWGQFEFRGYTVSAR